MPWVSERIAALGFKVTPSGGNFVLFHCTDESERVALDQALRKAGIILRPVANYGLPAALRATIGQEQENRRMVDVLEKFAPSR